MRSDRRQTRHQSGFTLIELISVIGVLGVVTATAVPRLTALAGEARYASLKVAQGALASTASIAHAQFMIKGGVPTFENVPLPMVNGYPGADPALADAAGLAHGYTVQAQEAGTMIIVPKDMAGTEGAARCYLVYSQSPAPHTPPTVAIGGDASAAGCT